MASSALDNMVAQVQANMPQWAGANSFPAQAKALLRADLQRMQAGKLGISDPVQAQMVEAARSQAAGEAAQGQGQLAQAALTAGPGGAASIQGAQQAALAGGQRATAQAAAGAATNVAKTSQQQAQAEQARIRSAIERQQDRSRENAQTYTQMAADTGVGVVGAVMPG